MVHIHFLPNCKNGESPWGYYYKIKRTEDAFSYTCSENEWAFPQTCFVQNEIYWHKNYTLKLLQPFYSTVYISQKVREIQKEIDYRLS